LLRSENNSLKFYVHVVCMEGKRWPKKIMALSPRGILWQCGEVGKGSGERCEAD
jgi:hypothetical protein